MNFATPTRLRAKESYRVLDELLCDRTEEALAFPAIVSFDDGFEDEDIDDEEDFDDGYDGFDEDEDFDEEEFDEEDIDEEDDLDDEL